MKLLEISFDNIGIFEKGYNFDLIASDRVLMKIRFIIFIILFIRKM